MKSIPLLNVEATNPPKSVTTPPPTFMTKLFLSPFNSVMIFQSSTQVSMFLFSSPGSNSTISIVKSVSKLGRKTGRQCSLVSLSAKIKMLEYLFSERNLFNSKYAFSLKWIG
ncbi:hypothetical protein D3C80_1629800 [compost metagenome]